MPSPKTKASPAIADPYAYVLSQMARGCALKTETYWDRRIATLGGHAIPPELVDGLESRKLIRCAHAWDKGPINGKFCDYELTNRPLGSCPV